MSIGKKCGKIAILLFLTSRVDRQTKVKLQFYFCYGNPSYEMNVDQATRWLSYWGGPFLRALLELQQQYYIVSSPHEPRFVLVPTSFASKAWPRPGLAKGKRLSYRRYKRLVVGFVVGLQACINIIERERLSLSRQEGTRGSCWVRFLHLKLI